MSLLSRCSLLHYCYWMYVHANFIVTHICTCSNYLCFRMSILLVDIACSAWISYLWVAYHVSLHCVTPPPPPLYTIQEWGSTMEHAHQPTHWAVQQDWPRGVQETGVSYNNDILTKICLLQQFVCVHCSIKHSFFYLQLNNLLVHLHVHSYWSFLSCTMTYT